MQEANIMEYNPYIGAAGPREHLDSLVEVYTLEEKNLIVQNLYPKFRNQITYYLKEARMRRTTDKYSPG